MTVNSKCKNEVHEERLEKAALNSYNESMGGKIENQNQHHNARKEGFMRKEQNQNN